MNFDKTALPSISSQVWSQTKQTPMPSSNSIDKGMPEPPGVPHSMGASSFAGQENQEASDFEGPLTSASSSIANSRPQKADMAAQLSTLNPQASTAPSLETDRAKFTFRRTSCLVPRKTPEKTTPKTLDRTVWTKSSRSSCLRKP